LGFRCKTAASSTGPCLLKILTLVREWVCSNNNIQGVTNILSQSLQNLGGRKSLIQKIAVAAISSLATLSFVARVQVIQQEIQLEHDEQDKEHHAWQESGQQFSGTTKNKPIPPPPSPASTKISESILDTALTADRIHNLTPKVCPLCQETRVIPTASISEYVFCYKCILDFVKKEGVNSVTGRDCDPTNVVGPYEPRT
jgi:hypothetical protein